MGIINVLDIQVANMIAAGEVVDRPASVIKELLENSIDAGADNICVEIKNGGISFMRVTDNGKGMEKDDVPVAILRHATSKIKTASDLDGIITLGFRGEALAAISSVSKMRIMTKTRDAEFGTLLESEDGEVVGLTDIGCADGTTVIVEELFGNVPARRKFLKKDSSETMAITATVEKIALSKPDIAIKYIVDGNVKFSSAGDGKLYNCIYSVLGKDFAKTLISVYALSGGVEISGFVTRPEYVKPSRNFQNFFINGRYVKSKTAMAAIEQAYSTFCESGKFPGCVLNVIIHPAFVDVNVHPAKLEVKFSNEKPVFEAIYYAVRNILEAGVERPKMVLDSDDFPENSIANAFVPIYDKEDKDFVIPTQQELDITSQSVFPKENATSYGNNAATNGNNAALTDSNAALTGSMFISNVNKNSSDDLWDNPFKFDYSEKNKITSDEGNGYSHDDNDNSQKFTLKNSFSPVDTPITSGISNIPFPLDIPQREITEEKPHRTDAADSIQEQKIKNYSILGEAFNSYIFVSLDDKLLVIDKHAAHERIIFEQFKKNMKTQGTAGQRLIFPLEILIDTEQCDILKEYRADLEKVCFCYNFSDDDKKVLLREIPANISIDSATEIFLTLVDSIRKGGCEIGLKHEEIYEKALYQASCKAAIKAGRVYDRGHIEWVCDKLMELDDIRYYPHGRPCAFEITKRDLEHKFKRS